MNRIEIPMNNTRFRVNLGISLLIVAVGVALFTISGSLQTKFSLNFIRTFSVLLIFLCLVYGFIALRNLIRPDVGMVIDDQGVTDHSAISEVGLITWDNIRDVEIKKISSSTCILVYVHDGHRYIDCENGLKRKFLEHNLNIYGTPIVIPVHNLDIQADALYKLIQNNSSLGMA